MHDHRRQRLFVRLVLSMCLAITMSAAVSKRASAAGAAVHFDIPPSDLATALLRFSEQAHLQVVSQAEQLRTWSTLGLRGTYTVTQALEVLLAPTDLQFQFTGNGGVVAIGRFNQAVRSARSAASSAVSVRAKRFLPTLPRTEAAARATGALPEVIVTAERRATALQSTPIAITVISGAQLQQRHLNTLSDLQTTVPGYQNDDEGGFFNSINIRGIGESFISPTIATGVAVFRDNVLMSESIAQDEPMFDIVDAEILEGPQGTLVGANSTAGAVVINSANPNFRGLNGYVLTTLANYSDTKWQGAVNLPLTDSFALRIAFSDEQRGSFSKDIGATLDGYFINTLGSRQPLLQGAPGQSEPIIDPGHLLSRQARLSMLWKPTELLQALLKVEYSFIDYGGQPGQPDPYTYQTLFGYGPPPSNGAPPAGCAFITGKTFNGVELSCSTPGVTAHSQYYYSGEVPRVLDYYGTAWQDNELQTRSGLELRYTLDDGIVMRSMSGFVHIDINRENNLTYGPQNGGHFYDQIGPNDDYLSEEINLISPTSGRINWLAGAYWNYRDTPVEFQEQFVSAPYQPGQLPSTASYLATASVNRMAAVFGQIQWQFTKTLQLQIGARENWDNNFAVQLTNVAPSPGTTLTEPSGTGLYSLNYAGTVPVSYTVLAPINAGTVHYRDHITTGKIDLNWVPRPGQNFYAFYARGYKTGGVNAQSTDHAIFNPEYLNDYEAGWKGRLLDGQVFTQVGAYYYDYRNMQYQLFDTEADNDTQTGSYVANLARSTIFGFEISGQSRFGGLGLEVGLDYNRSALGTVVTLPQYALPPGFGTPVTLPQCLSGHTYPTGTQCFNYKPYLVNVSGEQTPFSPRVTANISVDYRLPIGSGALDPRIIFSHAGKQYDSIFENTFNEFQPRNLWNGSLDWLMGPWDVQLYGTNLTNQTYVIDGGDLGFGTPEIYGPPRQLGVQVTRQL